MAKMERDKPSERKRAKAKDLSALVDRINKKYTPEGADKQVLGLASEAAPMRFIPCASPALGYILGTGGWPEGRLIELFGQEGAGKTTLLTMALKDCLEFSNYEKQVAIVDVEHKFDWAWAEHLGLPPEYVYPALPDNAEDATDIMRELIMSKQFCAIGYDSVGASIPVKMKESFADQSTLMGGVAQVMGRNVKIVAPAADLFTCTVFYVNQLRADMEGYHRPMTPGGHAVKHAVSMRVYIRPGRDKYYGRVASEGKESKVQVGYPMFFKVVKNSLGPPLREGWSDFYWEPSEWLDHVGFDVERDYQRLGLTLGLIERRGATYYYRDVHAQGRDAFFKALEEAGVRADLEKEVMARLKQGEPMLEAADEEDEHEAVGPDVNDPET